MIWFHCVLINVMLHYIGTLSPGVYSMFLLFSLHADVLRMTMNLFFSHWTFISIHCFCFCLRLTDCLWICTGFGGGGLPIVYGFGPDLEEKAYGLLTDFYWMWRTKLTECFRIFTTCGGRGLRIVYGFVPDLGEEACRLFMDLDRIWGRRLTDLGESGCWNLEATASFSLCSSPLAYIQLGHIASYFHCKIGSK